MRGARGFTLLEVMVATTLLSMVVVATLAAMRTFGNTRATLDQVTGRVDEVRAVSEFLRGRLTAAMPVARLGGSVNDVRANGSYGTYFLGDSRQVTWVAPFVAGTSLGGVFVMRLEHTDGVLTLRWAPYQREADDIDWARIKPRVLARSVESFEVGYLATYDGDWEAQWLGAQENPVALRLSVQASGRYWPELVVHLGGAALNMR